MKTIAIIIMLFAANVSLGQQFKLIPPNKDELKEQSRKNNARDNTIYLYLLNSYQTTSGKLNIQKYAYDPLIVCSFEQHFEFDIRYTTESCREAGGVLETLTLPRVPDKEIKTWIEEIYASDLTETVNGWNEEGNKFEPVVVEPGCYYELIDQSDTWLIKIYCGC